MSSGSWLRLDAEIRRIRHRVENIERQKPLYNTQIVCFTLASISFLLNIVLLAMILSEKIGFY